MTTASTALTFQREPELVGQTVVVIGGSAGIGFETARRACAEGADVILIGRNPERLKQAALELDAQSTATFDANDPAALKGFFQTLPTPIDHVMVTAGGPRGALLGMDFEQARRAISEHMLLALEVARNAAGKVRPGGTLLFMSGTGGHRPQAGLGIIPAVVAAMPKLTACLALETCAGPSQPHRPRLRRHAVVRVAPRRQTQRPPRPAPRDAANPAGGRTEGRCRARRSHHDQHGTHGRDI